jgi:plastocyanin
MRYTIRAAAALSLLLIAACGEKTIKTEVPPPPPANTLPTGPVTPCATCKVIEITMTSNEKGNFFEPKQVEAHAGDVLRFKVIIGVHNANFLPDSNPGKPGLPPASQLLQLAGQTQDIVMNFGTGTFYFQCDPHAALGMTGRVKVEPKE